MLGAGLFVALGAIMVHEVKDFAHSEFIARFGGGEAFVLAVGFSSAALGAAAIVKAVPAILQRGPILLIDERGVEFRRLPAAVGLVRWQEIDALRMIEMRGTRFLGLELRDERAFLRRLPLRQRCLLWPNRWFGYPALNVVPEHFDQPAERLLNELTRRFNESRPASIDPS